MIVDIQGVGNLWTDPQIHSLAGDDYGDGNLGVGGMALFFSTSRYGPVARALGLPLFALSPAEQARIDAHQAQLAASDPASAEGAPYVAPTQVSAPGGRYVSPTSPLHLPYISPTSPLHLPHISPAPRASPRCAPAR